MGCFLFRGYDHRVPNRVLRGEFYAEVTYECRRGYDFESEEANNKLFCSDGEWIGERPR